MPHRCLFGPVPAAFAEQKLHEQRRSGACLTFNPTGDADLLIAAGDDWEAVQARLPAGWEPDFLVLNFGYTCVPACLWSAPLPLVGLAQDWPLLWHYYRRRLRQCELVLTDTLGVETLHREGICHARAANLFGCDRSYLEGPWPQTPRSIDVLFAGNFNPAVQRQRLPWLARLARLTDHRRSRLDHRRLRRRLPAAAGAGADRLQLRHAQRVQLPRLRGGGCRGASVPGGRQPRSTRLLPRPPGVCLLQRREPGDAAGILPGA